MLIPGVVVFVGTGSAACMAVHHCCQFELVKTGIILLRVLDMVLEVLLGVNGVSK